MTGGRILRFQSHSSDQHWVGPSLHRRIEVDPELLVPGHLCLDGTGVGCGDSGEQQQAGRPPDRDLRQVGTNVDQTPVLSIADGQYLRN